MDKETINNEENGQKSGCSTNNQVSNVEVYQDNKENKEEKLMQPY